MGKITLTEEGYMDDKELKKIYKGTVNGKMIGHFRVYLNTYNNSTSFPIDLTQSDFDLLFDIRRSLIEQGAQADIQIERE